MELISGNEGDIVLIKKLGEPISQETISLKEAAEAAWWETQTEDPLIYKRKGNFFAKNKTKKC